MSRAEVRALVAGEVVESKPTRSSKDATRVYETWCEANRLPPYPPGDTGERQLLRFLHSNHSQHDWSWGTCTNYALGVAQSYARNGRADPRGQRVRAWLLAVKRHHAGRPAAPRTDALTDDQIVAAASVVPGQTQDRQVVRLRGLIAVAEALNVDPTVYGTALQRLARAAFQVREDDVIITDATGQRHLLDRHMAPEFFAALTMALKCAGDAELPLSDSSDHSKRPLTVRDTRKLRAAWDRAAPHGSPRVVDSVGAWRAAFSASTAEDRTWWLMFVDPDYGHHVQDVAYLLVNVETAFRHQTAKQQTLAQVARTTEGFSEEVPARQHKGGVQTIQRGGPVRNLNKPVGHLRDEEATCPAHCPACALDRHLQVRRRHGGADADPLWVTRQGRALALGPANRRLRAILGAPAARADGSPQVIGTRSLRVTAATLARQMGMTPTQIAALVTDHRQDATAELYIRRVDPFTFRLALPLT